MTNKRGGGVSKCQNQAIVINGQPLLLKRLPHVIQISAKSLLELLQMFKRYKFSCIVLHLCNINKSLFAVQNYITNIFYSFLSCRDLNGKLLACRQKGLEYPLGSGLPGGGICLTLEQQRGQTREYTWNKYPFTWTAKGVRCYPEFQIYCVSRKQ